MNLSEQHRAGAPQAIGCAVVTVSDTRTVETDTGGKAVMDYLIEAGHNVVSSCIIRDEPESMRSLITDLRDRIDVDVILMTGGTGITQRDQTFETVSQLLDKTLPGFGELFRMLSYQDIGAAAMLSRAVGGIVGTTILLTMPGSLPAVRLAMEKLIIPELPHLVQQSRK